MTVLANPICVFQVLKDLNKLTQVLLPLEKMLLQVKTKAKKKKDCHKSSPVQTNWRG